MIVSRHDYPLFELEIPNLVKTNEADPRKIQEKKDLYEFVINAALDPIDVKQWESPNMYLKTVDKYADLSVNCLITPSNAKLLILHNG